MTKKQIEYAKRYGADEGDVKDLENQLEKLEPIKVFHTNGFQHWKLPVLTCENPKQIQFMQWGLIPFWSKDLKSGLLFSNKTLNARGETILEKSSFKAAAKKRRCIILADGFFEHHHFKGKTYPYHIQLKDEQPMSLAGLYENWIDKTTGEILSTVTIVTTVGNKLMAEIHNNPKATGPRMPVILNKDSEQIWLSEIEDLQIEEMLNQTLKAFPAEDLKAFTVPKLRGKEAIGNSENAIVEFNYAELNQGKLF